MVDITVVGSCTMDLTSGCPRRPDPGETLLGSYFKMSCGGKGANQCCQAAKLGAKTGMVGVIGKDIFGDKIRENFKELNINDDEVRTSEKAATGAATIYDSEISDNYAVIVSNANFAIGEDDIIRARDMIMGAKVVVCQLEILPYTSLITLRMARNSDVTTILNCSPVWEVLFTHYEHIFTFCDIVVVSAIEARLLTNVVVTDVETAHKAGKLILEKGCKSVIITMAAKGCVLISAEFDGIHVPVPEVKVTDKTGADDSFVGALAYFKAYMPSLPLDEVCRRANLNASRSVGIQGTQNSFPRRDQLDKEIIGEEKP